MPASRRLPSLLSTHPLITCDLSNPRGVSRGATALLVLMKNRQRRFHAAARAGLLVTMTGPRSAARRSSTPLAGAAMSLLSPVWALSASCAHS